MDRSGPTQRGPAPIHSSYAHESDIAFDSPLAAVGASSTRPDATVRGCGGQHHSAPPSHPGPESPRSRVIRCSVGARRQRPSVSTEAARHRQPADGHGDRLGHDASEAGPGPQRSARRCDRRDLHRDPHPDRLHPPRGSRRRGLDVAPDSGRRQGHRRLRVRPAALGQCGHRRTLRSTRRPRHRRGPGDPVGSRVRRRASDQRQPPAASQLRGAFVMGLGSALQEETLIDPRTSTSDAARVRRPGVASTTTSLCGWART
jgi:hypothetical protein